VANPFRVETKYPNSFPQGFKANPGLKLANTFGVKLVKKTRSWRFVTQKSLAVFPILYASVDERSSRAAENEDDRKEHILNNKLSDRSLTQTKDKEQQS